MNGVSLFNFYMSDCSNIVLNLYSSLLKINCNQIKELKKVNVELVKDLRKYCNHPEVVQYLDLDMYGRQILYQVCINCGIRCSKNGLHEFKLFKDSIIIKIFGVEGPQLFKEIMKNSEKARDFIRQHTDPKGLDLPLVN